MSDPDQHRPLNIDRSRIRAAHEQRISSWPKDRIPLTVRATAQVTENHRKIATVNAFTIQSDEGPIVGGDGTAPSPLSYFVSAIGLAVLTDLVRAFAVFDLPADDLRLEVEAEFPLEAKYGDGAGGVAATEVRYAVDIASNAPRARIAEAVAWAEKYCHAVHSVRQSVTIRGAYRLAGEPLDPPA